MNRLTLLAHFETLGDGRFDVRCPATRKRIGLDGEHVVDCAPLTVDEMIAAVRAHAKTCPAPRPA